ncbi:unnamed protein product [Enterobius vermicularis]|uniref:Ovule protein n=1 Tax=Enterobius vermicularis TaxID=51028 RepID=A0A0N4VP22_ENTVE|nr:unnamed protein product [Enterobius vermicularis]
MLVCWVQFGLFSDTRQKNESTSDGVVKMEDIGSEMVQQASDDSSPSPSDSSNNIDDFAFNVNDLGNLQ